MRTSTTTQTLQTGSTIFWTSPTGRACYAKIVETPSWVTTRDETEGWKVAALGSGYGNVFVRLTDKVYSNQKRRVQVATIETFAQNNAVMGRPSPEKGWYAKYNQ